MPRPRKVVDDPQRAEKLAADRERKNKHNAELRAAGKSPRKKGVRRSLPAQRTPAPIMARSPVSIAEAYLLGRTAAWIRVRLEGDLLLDDDEARAILSSHPLGELLVRSDMTVAGLRGAYDEWRFGVTSSVSG